MAELILIFQTMQRLKEMRKQTRNFCGTVNDPGLILVMSNAKSKPE